MIFPKSDLYTSTKGEDNCDGFTLLELMSVLTLIGILLTSSIFLLQKPLKRSQAKIKLIAIGNQFIQDAHRARQLAMQIKHHVSIVPLCANHWDSGWMILSNPSFFENTQGVRTYTHTPTDQIYQIRYLDSEITTERSKGNGISNERFKGNQFEDMSLSNTQGACADQRVHLRASQSQKMKHLSFHPSGLAQMKRGGLIANRLVFRHQGIPEFGLHILMGAGGRLRSCLQTPTYSCYE